MVYTIGYIIVSVSIKVMPGLWLPNVELKINTHLNKLVEREIRLYFVIVERSCSLAMLL